MPRQKVIRHSVRQDPKRIVQAVAVQDGQQVKRLVVGLSFANMG
jgi:hypothetical protein